MFWRCTTEKAPVTWRNIEHSLQSQLIAAADGDTIQLPEGRFMFTKSLTLDNKKNIYIKGAGMDKTILSWKNQTEGAQGMLVSNSKNIVLEDFALEDAKGDLLKVNDTRGITLRRLRAEWTAGPKSENGAYALYPVLCKNVVMEECYAIGSSDAGIYVGQSDSVIIRNNKAYWNVAGIESENSRWVEIYGNEAYNNTGGLLVFDLPGLTQTGHHTQVYNNHIHDNNLDNFAQKGNIVASVPPGSGMMILATRDLDVHDNKIIDNRTVGIAMISYELVVALNEGETEQPGAVGGVQTVDNSFVYDTLYNAYPDRININKNTIENSHWFPSMKNDIGKLLVKESFMSPPDVLWDGIPDPKIPKPRLCVDDNGDIVFINLDAANEFAGLSKDPAPFRCAPQSK